MLNANEFFEIVGELYYNRYHRLRPGKSVPSVCGYDSSSEENTMQFKEWVEGPLAFNDAIERIGKLQFVLASDYEVLAASVDRLTSDKARLAAELAAEQESNTFLNNLHKVDQDRILAFEAALKEICECDRVARHCDACQEIATDALRTTAETACEHEWRSTQESYGEDADGNRGVMVSYEICTKCRARRDEL